MEIEDVVNASVVVVAVAEIVACFALIYLCTKLGTLVRATLQQGALLEAASFSNVTSLGRLEHEAQGTKDRDKEVAVNLAGTVSRADAMPKDGNYGAAADAALRSPEDM